MDVPLEICHDLEHFRLLELPLALLEQCTSASPPSLSIKSATIGMQDAKDSNQSHVVLCTDSQTYNVRQVQSSNSVYLIQPPSNSSNSGESLLTQTAVRAIAQCASTLELIPASTTGAILRQILPIYSYPHTGLENEGKPMMESNTLEKTSKQQTLENTPLSLGEFDKAWLDFCAFELDGQAWLPSAISLGHVWKSILSAAAVQNVNLVEKFHILDISDIVGEDGFPQALLDAILRRICKDVEDLKSGWTTLDQETCVGWIGGVLLESESTPKGSIVELDFLSDWKNQVPEEWRKHVAASVLKCKYHHPSKGRIGFGISADDGSAASVIVNTNGKRHGKWHEKFKNTRR